jgi:hypothetical protein
MDLQAIHTKNLTALLSAVGTPVTYNAFNTYGLFNYEPIDVLAMGDKDYAVQDTALTLVIASNSIGPIKNNTTITVNNNAYIIQKFIITGNGMETKLWLGKN